MAGFKLQILGQYHGLLRNFCERSQRVSPFWMVYSSGAPATGLMLPSGGGRGLCSVMMGAFAGRVLERHALEELQRAGAVAADFADQASEEQRVVGRTVARIRGDERQQIGLCLSVAPVIELLDRFRPGVVRVELARDRRVRIE